MATLWSGYSKVPAKSAKTATSTAIRGGLAPTRSARPMNSQLASAATAAVTAVSSHCGPRSTRANTMGINTRAVNTRFMPRVRIHRRGLACVSGALLPHHHAAFHHKAHALKCGYIFKRVAGDGDDVGKITGFQRADLPFPAKQLRSMN